MAQDVTSKLATQIRYLHKRSDVLIKNIAQERIPGAKAMDLKPPSFKNTLGQARTMMRTHSGHFHGNRHTAGPREVEMQDTFDTDPSGNNINLEEQMSHLAETRIKTSGAIASYKAVSNLTRLALTGHKS